VPALGSGRGEEAASKSVKEDVLFYYRARKDIHEEVWSTTTSANLIALLLLGVNRETGSHSHQASQVIHNTISHLISMGGKPELGVRRCRFAGAWDPGFSYYYRERQ
jgi:hypothetical protein